MSVVLSIIIPVFNEEKSIITVLNRIKEQNLAYSFEIIIVDDASNDNGPTKIDKYIANQTDINIKFYQQKYNQGKGAAIKKGIELVNGEYILIQDADLEYHPEEYKDLLTPLFKGLGDVVYGSRFTGSKPHRVLFFGHSLGNKFITFLSNVFTGLNLSDMECGFKAFRTSYVKQILLNEKRFGFEPEVTAKLARLPDIRFYEVGISYHGRSYKEGKKIGYKDGFRALYCIVKYGIKF
jgi:glycosyltransferase involved in cell wall biosynthesis